MVRIERRGFYHAITHSDVPQLGIVENPAKAHFVYILSRPEIALFTGRFCRRKNIP